MNIQQVVEQYKQTQDNTLLPRIMEEMEGTIHLLAMDWPILLSGMPYDQSVVDAIRSKFWLILDSYKPASGVKFSTYTILCVRNHVISAYRKGRRKFLRGMASLNDSPIRSTRTTLGDITPDNKADISQEQLDLDLTVELALTPQQKDYVRLRVAGFKDHECEKRMGVSNGTILKIKKAIRPLLTACATT